MKTDPRRPVLCMVLIASFLAPFMGSAVNIALPSIGRRFDLDVVNLNWIATAYILACTTLLLPMGRLADIQGRKRVFIAGIAVFALASLGCGLAGSFALLIVGRICQGIGAAMIFSTAVAILTSVYPARERGRVLGLSVAVVYLGLTLGPYLGGLLTQYLTWRSIFLATIPLCVFVVACAAVWVQGDWAESAGQPFDLAGAALYALGLPALIYSLSLPPRTGCPLMLAGLAALTAFIARETRTAHPLLDLTLFTRNRVFAFSNLAALIHYSATFCMGFLLSLYLQYVSGLGPRQAGLVLIAAPVVMTAVSPLAGRLSDRIAPRIIASAGMAITAASLALLTRLDGATRPGYLILTLIVSGLGFALFSSPNTNAVMGAVAQRDYGVASGILATMRMTGQTLSMAAAMLFFTLYLGRARITPATTPDFLASLQAAFTAFTALCLLGTLASLARGKQG